MTKQAWWLNSSYVFEEVYKIINAQHLDKNLNYIINKKIDYIFQKNNLLKNNNLINSTNPTRMLESCLRTTNDAFLKPISPTFYLDKTYILSAMGLLADIFPDKALRMLKKYLIPLN